ncbi:MAG: Isopenicillin synthase [Rhodospirillales bacterium]|nr:Isopenicillin synthase [Rhodospirillales bacterium]
MKKEVPVIDLQPYLTGIDKERVVREVADACEKIGFLVVSGHGVPEIVIQNMLDVSKRFFELATETKSEVRPTDEGVFRGYSPLANMSLAQSMGIESAPDLREGFTINRVQDRNDAYFHNPAAGKIFADNVWPRDEDVPGFRDAWTAYYLAQETLATSLMRIFALALGLSENFFDNKVDRHFSNMAAYHYPRMSEQPKPGQLRGGAHTDFGSLTLVYGYPSAKGLQVWTGDEWKDVPTVPGTFVVNLGDLMAQWTNDLWVSTLHRVANPPDEDWTKSRYSLIFFHQPNYDVTVESLDLRSPAKYPPVTSREHLIQKLSAMRVSG